MKENSFWRCIQLIRLYEGVQHGHTGRRDVPGECETICRSIAKN